MCDINTNYVGDPGLGLFHEKLEEGTTAPNGYSFVCKTCGKEFYTNFSLPMEHCVYCLKEKYTVEEIANMRLIPKKK